MVTREGAGDRRYGLGKSLGPLIDELQRRGAHVGYVSQVDLGARAVAVMRSFQRLILKLLNRGIISEDTMALAYGFAERANMGRLAAKLAAREGYTHIHCHDPIIAWGYRFFMRFLRRKGARWGITEHGFGSYMQAIHEDGAQLATRRMRFLRSLEAGILQAADWVVLPTQGCRVQLARDLSVHPIPGHWRVIPHPRPTLRRYDRREARDLLGWEAGACYVIAVGRLAPLKQFPALIKACAKLSDPRVRLVIIGDGDRSALRQLADHLGWGPRVQFAASDDMGLYYSAADIYVSTSITESFGLANLEALAAGVPSICTTVGGVPDVVGTGAYLIPAGDERALIQALRELVADPGARARLVRRGLERLAPWPDAADVTALYLAAYEGLDGPPRAVRRPVLIDSGDFWSCLVADFDHCPLPRPLDLPRDSTILVIAPHPDDEVLACGGTLALLRKRNCRIHVAIVTDGARGDPLHYSEEDVTTRRAAESRSALQLLGIDDVYFLGYRDGGFRASDETQARFGEIIGRLRPDWLLLPSPLDFHRDHISISLAALRAWETDGYRARAFLWELWQPLPATWVVDIGDVFALRQQAANCYQLPHLYCDYAGASAHLTGFRGLYIGGGGHAEAFLEVEPASVWSTVDHLLSLRTLQEHALTPVTP
jgi:glycosyltransferase involved in cell wall biosynthesis/LmbE family N-acetylglucosaminyl deacetylase